MIRLLFPHAVTQKVIMEHYLPKIKQLYGKDAKVAVSICSKQDQSVKKLPLWLQSIGAEEGDILLVASTEIFKRLAKTTKTMVLMGWEIPSVLVEGYTLRFLPEPKSLVVSPSLFESNLSLALRKIPKVSERVCTKVSTPHAFEQLVQELHQHHLLSCDIETCSLQVTQAGIYTIAFGVSPFSAFAVEIDCSNTPEKMREILCKFLSTYKGKLIFHKAAYDVPILIYNLFMDESFENRQGLLNGLDKLGIVEDTLLMVYLCTNSCAGNNLKLKQLAAQEYGDWGIDVKDITTLPVSDVLEYNAIDAMATYFLYEKYLPLLKEENQEHLYEDFKRYNLDCFDMQLSGFTVSQERVKEFSDLVLNQEKDCLTALENNHYVDKPINWSSSKQLQELLYGKLNLPILGTTKKGVPSIESDILNRLSQQVTDPNIKDLLTNIVKLSKVVKIKTSFLSLLQNPQRDKHGVERILGHFNLGGTVSGRMSSSEPNLQNMPATGTPLAKPFKKCFVAPEGWVFVGIDFAALEDVISALTTKDPNKLAVYIHGYDGHCLRAYSYFSDAMPDIVEEVNRAKTEEEKVKAINQIATKYRHLRQESKSCTYALTYQGTAFTLQQTLGFPPEKAKQIEEGFHKLYEASTVWVNGKLDEAARVGYITGAFGLKLRTPLLKSKQGSIAQLSAERRTAGNALGQSWGLLNSRAMNEVMTAARKEYPLDIYPVAAIHDACYYMVRNDMEIIKWLNQKTIKAAAWQELPEIKHDLVHLSGALDVFFPDWSVGITLPSDL